MSSNLYMKSNQSTTAPPATLSHEPYDGKASSAGSSHQPTTQDDIVRTYPYSRLPSLEKSPTSPIELVQNNSDEDVRVRKLHRKGKKGLRTPMKVEDMGQNDVGENSNVANTDEEDSWNWLLKVEKDYVETIADATMELQNRIHTDGPDGDDDDDEREYKYYYRGPEPEVSPLRIVPSEPWFAACSTDYRESYSSSESEDGGDDASQCDTDLEAESRDEETRCPLDLPCAACGKEACECTVSLLIGMTSTSLSGDKDRQTK